MPPWLSDSSALIHHLQLIRPFVGVVRFDWTFLYL
jgi:hypothetical protein